MKRSSSSRLLLKAVVGFGFVLGCNNAPKQSTVAVSPHMMSAAKTNGAASNATLVANATVAAEAKPVTVSPESQTPMTAVSTNFARGPQDEERKSTVDITAKPGFAHAPDYSWLNGEVQYSTISKTWRLRYASVDEDDPYGGSVTLAPGSHLESLEDGTMVHVVGQLEHATDRGIAPRYLATSCQALQPSGGSAPTLTLTSGTSPAK